MGDVTGWLSELRLPEYSDVFADNRVEVEVLTDLTDAKTILQVV